MFNFVKHFPHYKILWKVEIINFLNIVKTMKTFNFINIAKKDNENLRKQDLILPKPNQQPKTTLNNFCWGGNIIVKKKTNHHNTPTPHHHHTVSLQLGQF